VVTKVPLVDVAAQEATVADEVLAAVASVAREGRFVLGPRVAAFERWLADACGASHAVGVACGTDAIELSLRALGVGPGHGVVTPAFSFVAAAEAIAATGARPVFCDVDEATMNVTGSTVTDAIDRARRAGIRVQAVVPVHLFGLCAPQSELATIARVERLALVEDAAQAIGGRDEAGLSAGAVGDAGCFSFFPTKNLGAWGDGGAVVTSSDAVSARVRRLGAHGAVAPYVHAELGRNSRLDALQAAVLLAKTTHLGEWLRARERIGERYVRELAGFPLVLPRVPAPPAVHAWHAFVVRLPRGRDELRAWLGERGVETRVYYPIPIHRQECFRGLNEPDLPRAEEACRTALALPMFATMTDDQQTLVIAQVAEFFRRQRRGQRG
jgi:dTDP-4-amino-4,6-dideoxygalactose transaminase